MLKPLRVAAVGFLTLLALVAVAECQPSTASSGKMAGNVREFQVQGGDFYFQAKDLTATAGE